MRNKLILPTKLSEFECFNLVNNNHGIDSAKKENGVTVIYSGGPTGNKSLIDIQAKLGGSIVQETVRATYAI